MTQTKTPKNCTCGAMDIESCLCGTTQGDWAEANRETETKTTAQDRINAAAAEHGWTGGQGQGAGIATYRKGTRRVTVYYGVYGQVIDCSWQTGSTGGRALGHRDTGKAERVLGLLAADRWIKGATK